MMHLLRSIAPPDSVAVTTSAKGAAPFPSVTVLMATHGDIHLVVKSLAALLVNPAVSAVIINNDPTQDVAAWLDEETLKRTTLIESGYSAGYSRAMNRGLAVSSGEFVLLGDADLFVEPGYVETLTAFMARHPRAGCAGGKLLRFDLAREQKLDIIDSAGIVFGRNRRPMARGEGETDTGRYEEPQQLFGVDGAGLLARRTALERIKVDGEYFDENFFMYKEDTDLCWRLRLAGWECWYVPGAVAYHGRTTRGLGQKSYLSAIRRVRENERRKPAYVRLNSMRNQWLMLVKNEDGHNLLRDLHFIAARELAVIAYNLVFAPRTLEAVFQFFRALPEALRKRRVIKARQSVAPRDLRQWFSQ